MRSNLKLHHRREARRSRRLLLFWPPEGTLLSDWRSANDIPFYWVSARLIFGSGSGIQGSLRCSSPQFGPGPLRPEYNGNPVVFYRLADAKICIYGPAQQTRKLCAVDVVKVEGHTSGDLPVMWVKRAVYNSRASWPTAENCAVYGRAASIPAQSRALPSHESTGAGGTVGGIRP